VSVVGSGKPDNVQRRGISRCSPSFPLLHAKSLAKRINAAGPVASDDVRAVAAELATRFPPA